MKKILVIDDQLPILDVIRIILEEGGFDVETVSDVGEIYSTVNSYHPDLILLDIWMPGMDGRDVTKKLKKQSSTKDIPVIILSALSEVEVGCHECGADAFLSKPFDMDDLLNIAKKYTQH